MKICFFSKYPPIEGGVSSRTYWLAKGLGKAGHEIHIVTNALEVEDEYREKLDFENPEELEKYQPQNVFVHSLNYGPPKHIPYSQEYLARLINLGLEVVRDYDCDVIDSYYFLPYGLAAMFVKILSGKPLIIRHAGSDITRLFGNENFHTIFLELFKNADFIISNQTVKNRILERHRIEKNKIITGKLWGVDKNEFNPDIEPINFRKEFSIEISPETPVITYIGKYDNNKGINELLEALSGIDDDFFLLLLAGGLQNELLEKKISSFSSLKGKYLIAGFVPPWKIPAILKRSNCLVQLENNFPISVHMPIQPLEAFSVGTPVILSSEIFNKYEVKLGLVDQKNVFTVNPQDKEQLRKKLKLIIKDNDLRRDVGEKSLEIIRKDNFERAIKNNIEIYETAISRGFRLNLVYEEVSKSFWNFFEGNFKNKINKWIK
ncbi:MAG: glycosyltransferase family 4 protein [Patescibacteria group bacterium]